MTFNAMHAKDHFHTLAHEEKYVKLYTILEDLKGSSPIFGDMYQSVVNQDHAMSDEAMENYYHVILENVNMLDALHMSALEKSVAQIQNIEKHMHEEETTDADELLKTL